MWSKAKAIEKKNNRTFLFLLVALYSSNIANAQLRSSNNQDIYLMSDRYKKNGKNYKIGQLSTELIGSDKASRLYSQSYQDKRSFVILSCVSGVIFMTSSFLPPESDSQKFCLVTSGVTFGLSLSFDLNSKKQFRYMVSQYDNASDLVVEPK